MPPEGAQNLAVYMYVMAFGTREPVYRMGGYSTAMGVVMLIMVILMVLIVRSLMRRESVEY